MSAIGSFIMNETDLIKGNQYYKIIIQRQDGNVSINNPSDWKIIGKRYIGEYVEKGKHPNRYMTEDSFIFSNAGIKAYVRLPNILQPWSINNLTYDAFIETKNISGSVNTIPELEVLPGEGMVNFTSTGGYKRKSRRNRNRKRKTVRTVKYRN